MKWHHRLKNSVSLARHLGHPLGLEGVNHRPGEAPFLQESWRRWLLLRTIASRGNQSFGPCVILVAVGCMAAVVPARPRTLRPIGIAGRPFTRLL